MNEVLEKRTRIFANIKDEMETLVEKQEQEVESTIAKARELFNEFNDLLSKTQNQLISKEIILHDQMEVRAYNINLFKKKYKNSVVFRRTICFF